MLKTYKYNYLVLHYILIYNNIPVTYKYHRYYSLFLIMLININIGVDYTECTWRLRRITHLTY